MADNKWTEVYLYDYFLRTKTNSAEAQQFFIKQIIPWCHNNLPLDSWKSNGVTRYSFRIEFKDPEDAVYFKLKFN